jgi:hypothetical protein
MSKYKKSYPAYPANANQAQALGCVLPPDQTDFLAGQYFDIRLEVFIT